MKNQDVKIVKNILKDGMTPLASDDFNKRIISTHLSEQTQARWIPGYNYSFLFFLILLGMLLISVIMYFDTVPMNAVFLELSEESFMDKLNLLFIVIMFFMLFTFVSDIIESRLFKNIT